MSSLRDDVKLCYSLRAFMRGNGLVLPDVGQCREAASTKAGPWRTVPAGSQVGTVGMATPRRQASGSIRQGGKRALMCPSTGKFNF